jgi:hypothetical protein
MPPPLTTVRLSGSPAALVRSNPAARPRLPNRETPRSIGHGLPPLSGAAPLRCWPTPPPAAWHRSCHRTGSVAMRLIGEDGSIARGAQDLPGNWESSRFNLPLRLHDAIPRIGDHETSIVLHDDAVVQGLSEIPFMQDVERWGVPTIGTGLGNARFTNRSSGGN